MRLIGLALASLLLAVSGQASAQRVEPMENPVGKDWTHPPSKLVFPATLIDNARSRIQSYGSPSDVSAQYESEDRRFVVTVYVYQPAVLNAALWFGEARKPLEGRAIFGKLTPLAPPSSFAAPGAKTANGMRIVYAADGQYKSTALAIATSGDGWLIKFRISSQTHSAAELDAKLSEAIAALGWPKDTSGLAEAKQLLPCASARPFYQTSKPVTREGASAAAGLMGVRYLLPVKDTATDKPWCSDGTVGQLGLYRRDGQEGQYLLALGDSGRGVLVEADSIGGMIDAVEEQNGKRSKGAKPSDPTYSVTFLAPGTATMFESQDRMPSPEQALAIVQAGKVIAEINRNGGAPQIIINTGSSK
jgi:hypothetical protein